ncbi:hypothetical protein [Devosia sp. LjRoot3]|uniref:hypothetical protein n=1 Tax=Devosia sp. LjRoot3 TaxID=3342319 RepID=UPI003ECC1A54
MSFALGILVTPDAVELMKGYLLRAMPDVKSSHRCEALARGLGFRTYATMRRVSAGPAEVRATTDCQSFEAYLSAHAFQPSPNALFRAAALAALHQVRRRDDRLTAWGIGVGELQLKSDGSWESYQERQRRFLNARAELVTDGTTIPFLLSFALLQRIPATATIRSGTGSYKLKHIAENYVCTYPASSPLGPTYVQNGVLIAAAMHAGFRYKTYVNESGFEGVNVTFNMSKRAVDDLDCEIRPNGAKAQDRQRHEEMRRSGMLSQYNRLLRAQV